MTGRVSATVLVAALVLAGCSADAGPRGSGEPSGSPSSQVEPDRASDKGEGEPTVGAGRVQTAVLADVDGSDRDRCVDVADGRDVRSGGFAAGPFDEARAGYRDAPGDARTVRLYFVPEHSRAMPGITVTGQRTQGRESFREVEKTSSAVEQFRFYDVDVTVPAAGRWQIRATAGPDSGCWSVRFG